MTAGVLRGKLIKTILCIFYIRTDEDLMSTSITIGTKARFQLFGDTVNTAARMESSGMAGRVHISESTAATLVKSGRGKWLEKRLDTVVAKVGCMQSICLLSCVASLLRLLTKRLCLL